MRDKDICAARQGIFAYLTNPYSRSKAPAYHLALPTFARRRRPNMFYLSPAVRNRQESLGCLPHKRCLLRRRKHQVSVALRCDASEANFLPLTRKAGNPEKGYSSKPFRLRAILR